MPTEREYLLLYVPKLRAIKLQPHIHPNSEQLLPDLELIIDFKPIESIRIELATDSRLTVCNCGVGVVTSNIGCLLVLVLGWILAYVVGVAVGVGVLAGEGILLVVGIRVHCLR